MCCIVVGLGLGLTTKDEMQKGEEEIERWLHTAGRIKREDRIE